MRKFKYVLVMVWALISAPAMAAEQCSTNDVNITVNGLVCDFCARSIESLFGGRDEVASVDVDLDNGNIKIVMHDGKTIDDAELKTLIKDSGFDVKQITRGCE
jgi:copper chaperone CopZ